MKIYTKAGDQGLTSLYSGERKRKDDPTFEVLGRIDEVNSWLGLVLSHGENLYEPCLTEEKSSGILAFLLELQHSLLDLGANVANTKESQKTAFEEGHVLKLELEIDRMEAVLSPLKTFILPGGAKTAAFLHGCRTSTRACERAALGHVSPTAFKFINRLSDYFFVAARYANFLENVKDVKWKEVPAKEPKAREEKPPGLSRLFLSFLVLGCMACIAF